jgi:hypothetical protein
MKLTVNQLRMIIKEEVERALQEAGPLRYMRPDDPRGQLYLGMKRWLTNPGVGWPIITGALTDLLAAETMDDKAVVEELHRLSDRLGYSEDASSRLESSVLGWLRKR